MDAIHGRLSDYPVLADDVVTVQVTVPRGSLVFDWKHQVSPHTQGMQSSKPRPTMDPNLPVVGGRPNGGNMNAIGRGSKGSPLVDHNNDVDVKESRVGVDEVMDNRSYEKIKQTFKCPKFSGQAKD